MRTKQRVYAILGIALLFVVGACAVYWFKIRPQPNPVREMYGYIDKTGNFVIEPRFHAANDFSEGLACVAMVGPDKKRPQHDHLMYHYGFIDKTGARVIPPDFEAEGFWDTIAFHDGIAVVEQDFKSFRIDRTGKKLGSYEGNELFRVGSLLHFDNRRWPVLDADGKALPGKFYEQAWDVGEGLMAVRLDGKIGCIDKQGKVVIPLTFADIRPFHEGLAVAGVQCWKDKNGQFVWQSE